MKYPKNETGKVRRGEGASLVYETLHNEILSLALRPGAVLDEMSLARRFNMSRSPVREALNRLQNERLVNMMPNRSPIVAPIELTEFAKFVEALDLMQRYNTRLAARNRTDADLFSIRQLSEKFDESSREFDLLKVSLQNRNLHLAIARAGGNQYTTRQYAELLDEGRRLLHVQFEYMAAEGLSYPWQDQHEGLIKAIEERDVERADRLAHDHTMQFQSRFLHALHHRPDQEFEVDPSKLPAHLEAK